MPLEVRIMVTFGREEQAVTTGRGSVGVGGPLGVWVTQVCPTVTISTDDMCTFLYAYYTSIRFLLFLLVRTLPHKKKLGNNDVGEIRDSNPSLSEPKTLLCPL